MCVYTADIYESRSDSFHDIYHEINVKNHSSANSLQVPYFLIRRAAKKVTFIANMRTDLRVCECVCILPIYTSHPVTVFHDIYHEINVKNHSSANSLQVPYFLIRRAAKKVTFIANMRTDLRVCECVCILPIYTSHPVTVFHDIYHEINVKNHSSANSLQVPYFLIRRAEKKVTFIANMRTDLRVCECVCILPIYTSHPVTVFHDIYHEINVKNHSSANSLQVPYFLIRRAAKKVTFIANMRTDLRVCECVCILPIYTSHPVTVFHDIYHEINVKNHSSANSLQVPYFLIRRAAKK